MAYKLQAVEENRGRKTVNQIAIYHRSFALLAIIADELFCLVISFRTKNYFSTHVQIKFGIQLHANF